jgi:hypothetical protein
LPVPTGEAGNGAPIAGWVATVLAAGVVAGVVVLLAAAGGLWWLRRFSRWRARWHFTPASALWIALSAPGAFIMERRMLLGIKARAAPRPRLAHHH